MKLRLLAACTFAFSALASANGNLDPSYGPQADGRVIVPFDLGSPPTEQAVDALIDSDNRTYIVGQVKTADGLFQTGMTRLLPNGHIDQSFGVGGRSVTTSSWSKSPAGAAFASNGYILVAARRDFGDDAYFSVCNHSPETGTTVLFEGNNVACVFINPIVNGNDFVQDILVQPDGKIVLVGYSRNLAQKYIGTVVRLNSNGTVDNTFSGDGIAFIDLGDATLPHAVAWTTQNGGSILLCGSVRAPGVLQTDMLAARLRSDNGALDTSFSLDGWAAYTFDAEQNSEICNAMAVRKSDGVFFIAGQTTVGGVSKGAIKAVSPGGSPMANFAGGGLIIDGSGHFIINDVKLRADGSPVVLGTRADDETDLHVVAMTTAGVLQASFGTSGQRSIDFGLPGEAEQAAAMVLQNGRPVVVGHALTAPGQGYDFVAARLDTDVIFADGFIK
ncbi:delta-60 repeat domain-containing protein [Tahibacter harae]|uniref:Delta-60 repeat domain-containing protein n=1 Tax=Tahibacter harae TaxID=2963937 RepID=A0ABT1QPI1_9GAMM|nr:delta-60 repeat domain-containing protein [Tahibacter harae]MCQ4164192.1 delta-60 repeat domain-containing protein [Tahibacter harae]